MAPDLAERSLEFANEIQALLESTVGCPYPIVSVKAQDAELYVVRPADVTGATKRVPLTVNGAHLADLELMMFQSLDREGRHLKTTRSDFRVFSTIARTPLLRLEYDSAARVVPTAHWQFHAERGDFSHLLTLASQQRTVRGPGDLSQLHLPVGGERFRPGLEDLLEFLIRECGVDHREGWRSALRESRRSWRLRQLRSAVRDQQQEVADVMRSLGWTVSPPNGSVAAHDAPFTQW